MEGYTSHADVSLLDIPENDNNQDCELEEQYDYEDTFSSDEAHEALATLEALETLKKACEGNIAESVEDLGVWEKYIECVTVKVEDNLGKFGSSSMYESKLQLLKQQYLNGQIPQQTKTTRKSPNKTSYQLLGPYTCSYTGCEKAYKSKWDHINHMKTVHQGLEHRCPGCGKNFSKKANLMGHIRKKICSKAKDGERKVSKMSEDSEAGQKKTKIMTKPTLS